MCTSLLLAGMVAATAAQPHAMLAPNAAADHSHVMPFAQEHSNPAPAERRTLTFDHPDGPYTHEMFARDSAGGRVPEGRDFASIVNATLRIAFNAGKKVSDTGFSGHIAVPPRPHYTLSFKIRFPEHFEAGLHGKQLGLSGGKGYDGGRGEEARAGGDGWSIRLQFDAKPNAVTNTLYVYHADMTGKYGGPAGAKPFPMDRGQWYAIRMAVTMNTADDQRDGQIRVWCDDELKIDVRDIRFARIESGRQIDRIRLEVFPGGGGAFPSTDTYLEIDDFSWTDAN